MTAPYPVSALASSSSHIVAASGSSLLLHSSSSETFPSSSSSSSSSSSTRLVRHIALSFDSAYTATVDDSKSLRVYSNSDRSLLSTRLIPKRASDLSFTPAPENSIIITDKVGDVYLYPLHPRPITGERPTPVALGSDPTLNPDATYLLGHVSILNASVLSHDGKYLITADRDEHIRVSRFPKSYIIERYLFGSDGFISALHIPASSPHTLISAGGEQWLRIWDWTTGELKSKVDVYPSVFPHRRVRSSMRKVKPRHAGKRRGGAGAEEVTVENGTSKAASMSNGSGNGEASEEAFYSAPEGFTLPSGQGVCIKKIQSVQVEGQTVVLFYSEGAAAIFAFPLDPSSSTPPPIHTLPLDFPILDFTSPPSNPAQILISLDTTWGIAKQNPLPGQGPNTSILASPNGSITAESQTKINSPLIAAEISSSQGWKVVPDHPVIKSLTDQLSTGPIMDVAKIQLYPLLSLLPRWPGMEEDDDLAGPAGGDTAEAGPAPSGSGSAPGAAAQEGRDDDIKRNYTKEELEGMGNKMLGRLKSQGVDVEDYFRKKQRRPKGPKGGKKEKVRLPTGADRLEGDGIDGGGGAVDEEDIEAQMNA